jgi:hypothetical protein
MKKQKTFKVALREDVLPALRARHQYFSIKAVRAELARQRIRFGRNTLKCNWTILAGARRLSIGSRGNATDHLYLERGIITSPITLLFPEMTIT